MVTQSDVSFPNGICHLRLLSTYEKCENQRSIWLRNTYVDVSTRHTTLPFAHHHKLTPSLRYCNTARRCKMIWRTMLWLCTAVYSIIQCVTIMAAATSSLSDMFCVRQVSRNGVSRRRSVTRNEESKNTRNNEQQSKKCWESLWGFETSNKRLRDRR